MYIIILQLILFYAKQQCCNYITGKYAIKLYLKYILLYYVYVSINVSNVIYNYVIINNIYVLQMLVILIMYYL